MLVDVLIKTERF